MIEVTSSCSGQPIRPLSKWLHMAVGKNSGWSFITSNIPSNLFTNRIYCPNDKRGTWTIYNPVRPAPEPTHFHTKEQRKILVVCLIENRFTASQFAFNCIAAAAAKNWGSFARLRSLTRQKRHSGWIGKTWPLSLSLSLCLARHVVSACVIIIYVIASYLELYTTKSCSEVELPVVVGGEVVPVIFILNEPKWQ